MNQQLDLEDLNDNTIYYEDLEIGDYVRFIDYDLINTGQEKVIKIGQIEAKYSDILEIKLNNNLTKIKKHTTSEIIKHSKNIIDLIEVGDYVNGKYVYKITAGCIYFKGYAPETKGTIWIKSIVTKEQFKAVEYEM